MPQSKPTAPITTPTPIPALVPVDRPLLLLEMAVAVELVVAGSLEPVKVTVEASPEDEVEDDERDVVVDVDTMMFAASMSESGDAASKVSDVGLLQSVPPSSLTPQQCHRPVSVL